MSNDGHMSNQHIAADQAMRAIVGGVEVTEDDVMTDAELREQIMSTSRPSWWDPETGYRDSANYAAKLIMRVYEQYPMLQDVSDDTVFLKDKSGNTNYNVVVNKSFYKIFKELLTEEELEGISGLSGFQWGWAMNAARTLMGLGPVPNPALMTFIVSEDSNGGG